MTAAARWLGARREPPLDERDVAIEQLTAAVERRQRELDAQRRRRDADWAELEQDRTVLQELVDHSPAVIFVKDLEGRFTLVNAACTELLGRSALELLGTTDDGLVGAVSEQYRANDAQVVATGQPMRFEEPYWRGDTKLTFLSTKFPVHDPGGAITGVAGISVDISPRIEALEAARDARDEAARASSAKSEFLSRMSHELRTPLNSLLGFAQLMSLDELSEDHRESVGYMLRAGQHLLDLINEVLDIARVEAGAMSLSIESVRTSDVVEQAAELARPLAAARAITFEVACDAEAGHVRADRQRLLQVLLNLLSNAVKYNRSEGEVVLGCSQVGDRVELRVSDTGPGLTDAQVERLFDPFDRLGAEHTDIEGTGVGLTLSSRLVELMHGSISVRSVPGTGSTFTVSLPAAAPPTIAPAVATPQEAPGPRRRRATPIQVLYVEDNVANLALFERLLRRDGDVELLPAMTGSLALELAVQHRPDVVLLDLHLPDMDGAEVLASLRAEPATSHIPVLVVSADASERSVARLLRGGAAAYLTKPVDLRELRSAIEAVVHDV